MNELIKKIGLVADNIWKSRFAPSRDCTLQRETDSLCILLILGQIGVANKKLNKKQKREERVTRDLAIYPPAWDWVAISGRPIKGALAPSRIDSLPSSLIDCR